MPATATQLPTDRRLIARFLRSSSWIILGYGASQVLRLISNLILAKLLFPEAFGLMALISVITLGLILFSDVGISPSIAQSKRGDDPDFLNTAWTVQVLRGFGLWLAACALAYPVSIFYEQPDLVLYLPIAAFALVLNGFEPTRIHSAQRHLKLGRVTALDLVAQTIGICAMIGLAILWQSVAALVVGGLVTSLAMLTLSNLLLPGLRNSLRFERPAVTELVIFGKWIFLSTLFGFFSSQGDKLILGKFLTLENLGLYNIGFFLASFPILLGQNVTGRVMIPVYRDMDSTEELHIRRIRYGLTGGLVALLTTAALIGPQLVDLLYDARYLASGAIIVVLAVSQMPVVIGMSYDQAALARGDSRRFFVLSALRASFQISFLLIGIYFAGLIGAMIGMGMAALLAHGVTVWLARAHGVWHAMHDVVFFTIWVIVGMVAYTLHGDTIHLLLGTMGR